MALKNDGTVKIGTELDSSGLTGGMKKAEKSITSSGNIASTAIAGITSAAALAGSALTAIGTYAVSVGGDFSAAMSQVQAVSGASSGEMAALTRKAEEMGSTTKFSATEAANALNYMAMAGWDTQSMVSGLDGIMNLAAASGADLATTSDIVTDALTAFGLSASDSGHFADVLAAASSNANTNVTMMGETFKYAAPVAGALGYSAEDCAVAIGLMANAGIKSSQAGTAMRSWLTRMAKPTKESQTAMDALGISLTNTDGSMKSLGEIMDTLRTAFSGLTEEEAASYAAMLGGQEAMSGILAIANAEDLDYLKLTKAIEGCDGAAKNMSTTMQDNLPGDITIAKSAMEGFGIATYINIEKPLRKAVNVGTDKINTLTARMKDGDLKGAAETIGEAVGTLAEKIIGFAADGTAALISTAGWIIDHKGAIAFGVGVAGAAWLAYKGFVDGAAIAQGILNTAMSLNPIALIVAGVAAAGTAFYLYNRRVNKNSEAYEKASDKLEDLKEDMELFDDTLTSHKEGFEKTKDEINGNAAAADAMADKLFELAGQSGKTAADEMRLKMMCEELNKLVPNLNIAYDTQTGSLTKTREQVDLLTKAYKKQAIAQAYQEQMNLLGSDYAAAVRNQVLAEDEVNRLAAAEAGAEALREYRSKANEIYRNLIVEEFGPSEGKGRVLPAERLKELWDQAALGASNYMDANSELTVVLEEGEVTAGEYIALWNDASDNLDTAKTNVNKADEAFTGLTEEMERVYSEYGIATEATEENTGAVQGNGEAAVEATRKVDALQAAMNNYAEKTGVDVEKVKETFDALSEKYAEAYNAAYSSITGQLGLFDKFQAGEAYTAEEVLENLQSQITGMTDWSNNMQTLAKAGIDEGLLKELRDAGPQASAQVKVIADQVLAGNTQFITDLNNSYRTKMNIADSIATEFAETETGFLGFSARMGIKFTTLLTTMNQKGAEAAASFRNGAASRYQDMLNAGVSMSDGLINGVVGRLSSRIGEVSSTVARINTVARQVMAVHSPSKVMVETGEYIGEGLIIGTVDRIEDGISLVRDAVSDYADKGIIDYAEKVAAMQGFAANLPGFQAAADRDSVISQEKGELIDYDRFAEAIARKLDGVRLDIDGQSVGYMTAGYVNEAIGSIAEQEGRGVI